MEPALAEAFRQIPYGVYILTVGKGSNAHALVVSWVSQVSYSPPLLMAALRRTRKALPAVRETGFFSLSLLKKDQEPLVPHFKEPFPKIAAFLRDAGSGLDRPPILKDCKAYWECRLVSTVEAGDHILCLGEVRSSFADPQSDPLTTLEYGKTYIGQY